MVKVIIFIKRRADLSMEAFRRHYEEVHVPLSFEHLPLMRKHARNYVWRRATDPEPEYDCVTECWFDSWEDMKATGAMLAGEKKEIIRQDEARFIASTRSIVAEESVSVPG
jgi:uncharacterized protein (TIGR02118 family)